MVGRDQELCRLVKYAWVCIYAPVNVTSKKGLKEREVSWEEMNACLKSFEKDRKLVMMGDMNAKVGDECVMDVVGKWGILERTKMESGWWVSVLREGCS